MIIGYIDDFKLMLILTLAALPFVLMIRSGVRAPQKGQGHAPAMD